MDYESVKMTEVYLSLWKLLDVHHPGHHSLELTSVSKEKLEKEISKMSQEELQWAGDKKEELGEDIQIALQWLHATVEPEWAAKGDELRKSYQDKALRYAAKKAAEKHCKA